MKKFTNVFLLAGTIFISSCISVTSNSGSGKETTSVSTIPGSEISPSPNAIARYKVESVKGSGYFDVNKDIANKVFPKIGEVLKTKYFEVTVTKIIKSDYLNFGIIKLDADNGYSLIRLEVTIKNTDNVKRKMFPEGFLWVYGNNIKYKFEITETVSGDGIGFNSAEILPSASESTNIIYKIANDIKGAAYFQPEQSDKSGRISLGKI